MMYFSRPKSRIRVDDLIRKVMDAVRADPGNEDLAKRWTSALRPAICLRQSARQIAAMAVRVNRNNVNVRQVARALSKH